MSAATEFATHPPIDPEGFAVEYDCGCVQAWCQDDRIAGLFYTDLCERHRAASVAEDKQP